MLFKYVHTHLPSEGEYYLTDEKGNWVVLTKDRIISSEVSSLNSKVNTDEAGYVWHRFQIEVAEGLTIAVIASAQYRHIEPNGIYVHLPTEAEAALFKLAVT